MKVHASDSVQCTKKQTMGKDGGTLSKLGTPDNFIQKNVTPTKACTALQEHSSA